MTFPPESSKRSDPESATKTSPFARILSSKAWFSWGWPCTVCVDGNGTWLNTGPWVPVHLLYVKICVPSLV